MLKFPWRFWLAALVAGLSFDVLFWGKPFGISFLIWMGILVISLVALTWMEKEKPSLPGAGLAVITLGLAVFSASREEGLSRFLSVTAALGCFGLLVLTWRSGWWWLYRLRDYFLGLFRVMEAFCARPVGLIKEALPKPVEEGAPRRSIWKPILAVLVGLILAFPILLIFGGLLASADPIFADKIKNIWDIFSFEKIGETIVRTMLVVMFTWFSAGLLAEGVAPKTRTRPDPVVPWFKPFLGSIETGVILGAVDLLFALFVTIQFQYLFGGQANITAAGYTYSEYARRGFGELVWVALLSLGLVIVLSSVGKQQTSGQRRSFVVLSVALMAQVLVMLASAMQRLMLYENAYGFTQLRTYTHFFIPWLGVLLAAVIALILFNQRGRIGLALFIFCLGYVVTLNAVNVDGWIVHQNIAASSLSTVKPDIQTLQNSIHEFDANYVRGLSLDAVPAMVSEYQRPGQTAEVREALRRALACQYAKIEQSYTEKIPWMSWGFSRIRARNLLNQNPSIISGLKLIPESSTFKFSDDSSTCQTVDEWD